MAANVLFMNLLVPIRSPQKSPRLELRCKSPNLCTGMLNGALIVNPLNKNPSEVVILSFSKILAKPKTSIQALEFGANQ